MGFLNRVLRFLGLARDPASAAGFTVIEGPDGQKMLVDAATLAYMQSDAPQPTQASLDEVLDRTRRIRVFDDGVAEGELLGETLLVDAREPEDLQALREALRIEDEPGGHCMCHGSEAVELLDADDRPLARLGVHHGLSIRWDAWKDDALLTHPGRLLEWMALRGAPGPLREFEQEATERKERDEALDRWKSAAPACLAPWIDPIEADGQVEFSSPEPGPDKVSPEIAAQTRERIQHPDFEPLDEALREALPADRERARALFAWYGAGAGPWTGYPAYESIVDLLLCRMPTEQLVAAVSADAGPEVLEGAARHFSGMMFVRKRGALDRSHVTDEVRERLLGHLAGAGDPEKLQQAQRMLA